MATAGYSWTVSCPIRRRVDNGRPAFEADAVEQLPADVGEATLSSEW